MEIEIWAVPNCPNAAPTVAQVRQALDHLGLPETDITTHVIADQEQAERTGFTCSPTILIDGTTRSPSPITPPG